MAFIEIFLALGTLATLGYAGYVLFLKNRGQQPHENSLPFLPKVAEAEIDQVHIENSPTDRIFEAYIADKFDREEYRLVHWNRDKRSGNKSLEKSFPTLSFQLVDNGSIQFSVECQYAPSFTVTNALGVLPQQIERCHKYQQQNNRVVFVIFGVGGSPEKPERLYVVPLNDIPVQQEFLPASYLSRYRKLDLKSNFFLLPERMLLI